MNCNLPRTSSSTWRGGARRQSGGELHLVACHRVQRHDSKSSITAIVRWKAVKCAAIHRVLQELKILVLTAVAEIRIKIMVMTKFRGFMLRSKRCGEMQASNMPSQRQRIQTDSADHLLSWWQTSTRLRWCTGFAMLHI